jgi:hypothetical protein
MPAKLPAQFLKPETAKVGDIQPGSHAFIASCWIWVDFDRTIYLPKCANLAAGGAEDDLIKVSRDSAGAYCLDFQGNAFQLEPKNVRILLDTNAFVPVESVKE